MRFWGNVGVRLEEREVGRRRREARERRWRLRGSIVAEGVIVGIWDIGCSQRLIAYLDY